MTTEQTAQQLELAAQILRTGHPWGYRHIAGSRYKYNTPIEVVADGNFLSPLLATPPDNRPLHNPDNLTAEAVGVGWRLAVAGDTLNESCHFWHTDKGWKPCKPSDYLGSAETYRLPLSVPWPELPDPYAELKAAHAAGKVIQYNCGDERAAEWEDIEDPEFSGEVSEYRIKPEPAFQLPPPPSGMRWHREDGWKEGDLPSGYRPLAIGEGYIAGDQYRTPRNPEWRTETFAGRKITTKEETAWFRTTRPLTFNHAGQTWTYHRPGDQIPCESGKRLEIIYESREDDSRPEFTIDDRLDASCVNWKANTSVIGWRYADEKKTVPLGPEDVRCGDEITIDEYDDVRRQVLAVESTHIHLSVYGRIDYETLRKRQAKIRRRDSNEFVPCSKQIPV